MKSLLIRNLAPATVEALKRRARRNHRSLEGELRAILEDAANGAPLADPSTPIPLHTVNTGRQGSFPRDEIYGDSGR